MEEDETLSANVPDWANVQPTGGNRYLPIYLLLDTSSSMDGEPIADLRRGLEQFRIEGLSDAFTRDTVRLGIIVFGSEAQLLTDGLVSLLDFRVPDLQAGGVTRLDRAFNVLQDSLDRHVARPVKGGSKGDWKPWVFVLTDGYPTDPEGHREFQSWVTAREGVLNRPRGVSRPAQIVVFGCGPDVDEDTIKDISTGSAFSLGKDTASLKAFFQFITQTVSRTGSDVVPPFGTASDGDYNPFPDMPEIIRIP